MRIVVTIVLLSFFVAGCQSAEQPLTPAADEIKAYLKASDEEYALFHKALIKVMEAIPAVESTDEPPTGDKSQAIKDAVKEFTQTCNNYQASIEQRPTPSEAKALKQLELKRLELIRESVALEFKRLYVDNPHHRDYYAARKKIDGVGSQTQEALLGQRQYLMGAAGMTPAVQVPAATPTPNS